MKIAVLDLGTNTFNLAVGHFVNEHLNILVDIKVPVKLGDAVFRDGGISLSAQQRAKSAIKSHLEIARKHQVVKIVGVATSAFREANNGQSFIKELNDLFGLELEIIDGKTEAELIFKSIHYCVHISKPSLIIDIGGGSTEIIYADNTGIKSFYSHKIGVSMLKKVFAFGDVVSGNDINEVNNSLRLLFKEQIGSIKKLLQVNEINLIGSSGAFDTLADINYFSTNSSNKRPETLSYELNIAAFKKIYAKLLSSSKNEKLQTKGLEGFRAEYIIYGMFIVNFILSNFTINKIIQSKYSLKEGVLLKHLIKI